MNKNFTAKQLREMWLKFYEDRGHKVIPSASIIPENDPSVLFTTAGMHPLVPYLLGEKHPAGKRLCNVQKCIRTGDIDEVGDNSHLTFFEMLGNWSLGDYFKKEKVSWSYEFLIKCLGLKTNEFAVTCFAGDENSPQDMETAELWEKQGVPKDRIFFLPKSDNWWEINRGPCGPDSEIFIDTGKPKCCPECNPSCHCGKYIEIGNDVYMQYNKVEDTEYIPAKQKNVDTGFGLERNLIVLNGANSVFVTEPFEEAMKVIEKLSDKKYNDDGDKYTRSFRIVADHVRAATAIIGDEKGINPSNTGAGYVLRRLIRKAIRHCMKLDIEHGHLGELAVVYCNFFKDFYPEFEKNKNRIVDELNKEEERFLKTVKAGEKEFDKVINGLEKKNEFMKKSDPNYVHDKTITGKSAFRLYDTFGFPVELTVEMAKEIGYSVDIKGYEEAFKKHQELARTASAGQFKGGLAADGGEKTARLHTATHLLLAGLRKFVSPDINQMGSNITTERLRFDFNCDHKLTDEEIKNVEDYVNKIIKENVPVVCEEMTLDDAKKKGAIGIFESKYGDRVKVYSIGEYDKQICGGPHAKKTGELGWFKIIKEESSSSGVRRIKAKIQD